MRARARVAQRLEPLEREREVRAALVARDRVDLVDDHGLDGAQRFATARARDEQVQRLGRGDDEARRLAHHRRALRAGVSPVRTATRMSGAVEAELARDLGDLRQRSLQVLGDVDRERLERRHVDDPRRCPSIGSPASWAR